MTFPHKLVECLRKLGVSPSVFPPDRLEAWAVRMRFYNMTPEEAAAGFITYIKRSGPLPTNGRNPKAHIENTIVQWDYGRKLDLERLKQVMTWIA